METCYPQILMMFFYEQQGSVYIRCLSLILITSFILLQSIQKENFEKTSRKMRFYALELSDPDASTTVLVPQTW